MPGDILYLLLSLTLVSAQGDYDHVPDYDWVNIILSQFFRDDLEELCFQLSCSFTTSNLVVKVNLAISIVLEHDPCL